MTNKDLLSMADAWPYSFIELKRLHDVLPPGKQNERGMISIMTLCAENRIGLDWFINDHAFYDTVVPKVLNWCL